MLHRYPPCFPPHSVAVPTNVPSGHIRYMLQFVLCVPVNVSDETTATKRHTNIGHPLDLLEHTLASAEACWWGPSHSAGGPTKNLV